MRVYNFTEIDQRIRMSELCLSPRPKNEESFLDVRDAPPPSHHSAHFAPQPAAKTNGLMIAWMVVTTMM